MPTVLSISEVGGRKQNEDAYRVLEVPDGVVCFVADGQGGQPGGGPAANLACRVAAETVGRLARDRILEPQTWSGILRLVDQAVEADAEAGVTTFLGVCNIGNRVVGASSGDSAVLAVTESRAVDLTASQRKNPPIGSGSAIGIPYEANLTPPWRLLAMTDGVWKYVGWEKVIETAQCHRGAEVIEKLTQAARLPGSGRFQDDFTLVLVESDETG